MFANAHPLGFLAAAKALDAEHLIGQTEQLVMALGPSEADLKPAEEALAAAKALYAAQDYSKAIAGAKRAAALAVSLNERFSAYMAAWKVLQACMEELERLGFPTEGLEVALAAADREVVRQVEEGGTLVPNYLGATEELERATEEARTLVTRARETSHEIFLATLAVEALSDSPSTPAPSWLGTRLDRMVEQATRELALGHVPAASQIASETRARADDALAGAARTWELLDLAAAILDGLGAMGRVADALREKIESARGSLARGFLDRTTASVVAHRLSDEVASFAKHYPRARSILERAERVYARLQEDGFCSYDVDGALSEARRALEAGEWESVRQHVERASQSFLRLRTEQEALTQAIAEIDERVSLLKDCRLPLLPEVQEILDRAKEEVRSCRLSGAGEDLLLANSLMMQATRTGS
jgi:tetratricopeptide (TPR) repeat protein